MVLRSALPDFASLSRTLCFEQKDPVGSPVCDASKPVGSWPALPNAGAAADLTVAAGSRHCGSIQSGHGPLVRDSSTVEVAAASGMCTTRDGPPLNKRASAQFIT